MRSIIPVAAVAVLLAAGPAPAPAPAGPAAPVAAAWTWPVTGPVIQPFDPPEDPYGSGHRGIDIAAPVGTAVLGTAAGVVTFAGPVGGRLFLTIDHGDGLESTYSWLSSLLVRKGDPVVAGQPVATTGWGHPAAAVPHLHLGVKLHDAYVDPLAYLEPVSVDALIRLAPVAPAG
jgi:murein DD-endopeptidase MepM/ murein hydrolase activator NlpD